MPLWNDDDPSISSVFDWGSSRSLRPGNGNRGVDGSGSGSGSGDSSDNNPDEMPTSNADPGNDRRPSRYDPRSMKRILDITDLVDDSSGSEEETIVGKVVGAKKTRKRGSKQPSGANRLLLRQQVAVFFSLVAIIVACGAVVILAIIRTNPDIGAEVEEDTPGLEQQRLLEIAEQVSSACSEYQLNEDVSNCEHLCNSSMCCFDGEDACEEDDNGVDCVVYAGCAALG